MEFLDSVSGMSREREPSASWLIGHQLPYWPFLGPAHHGRSRTRWYYRIRQAVLKQGDGPTWPWLAGLRRTGPCSQRPVSGHKAVRPQQLHQHGGSTPRSLTEKVGPQHEAVYGTRKVSVSTTWWGRKGLAYAVSN